MRTISRLRHLVPVALFVGAAGLQACGSPPVDDQRIDRRLFPVAGVIEGTLTYNGVHPCSRNGHIIGNAIVLVFDRRNPPPPAGLGNTAANFAVVEGDNLFFDEPRNPGPNTYCPADHGNTQTITVSLPFTVSPMQAGSYIIQSFFDADGTFFPLFKFRNLPKMGDALGGYIDLAGAQSPAAMAQGINFQPTYLPIDIGNPLPLSGAELMNNPNAIPEFVLPNEGFVRSGVAVVIGAPAPVPRPYFYGQNPGHPDMTLVMNSGTVDPINPPDFADSSDKPAAATPQGKVSMAHPNGCNQADAAHPCSRETDPNYAPIITMPQDWQVDAQPSVADATQTNADQQQTTFLAVRLQAGLPAAELPLGVAVPDYSKPPPYPPFQLQLNPDPMKQSLFVWSSGNKIPESNLIPQMYPLVVFAKLVDDQNGQAAHSRDPQSVTPQGSTIGPQIEPVVIIQGLTLYQDSLFSTTGLASGPPPSSPADPKALADHVTVLVRPSVICFNPAAIDQGGLLVTPHEKGPYPTNPTSTDMSTWQNILQPDPATVISRANASAAPTRVLVKDFAYACLPKGRYEMNAVYPTGQAWTAPNEAGSCSQEEGLNIFNLDPTKTSCSLQPRPLLYSQGNRTVLEIIDAENSSFCQGSEAVPKECLPCTPGQDWGKLGTCPAANP
jgi:hypothetical protein